MYTVTKVSDSPCTKVDAYINDAVRSAGSVEV